MTTPPRTILIAEDDFDLSHFLTMQCKRLGYDVFRSPDAMHALLGVHRIKPALMILDLNMPGGNGLSVCEMLAGDPQVACIPAIIISGQQDAETMRRCRAAGVRFVPKGATLWQDLSAEMNKCLNEPTTAEPEDARDAPADEATSSDGDQPTSGEGRPPRPKIMSIDDDAEFTEILKRRLEPHGLDVYRAFSGMQGFWSSLDVQPDVIISDLQMGDGDGMYILQRLRAHPLTEKTPIIFLTGETNPALRRQLISQGAAAYLTKPLRFDALLDALRSLVPLLEPVKSSRAGAGAMPQLTTGERRA